MDDRPHDSIWWMHDIAERARAKCSDTWTTTDPELWRACRHAVALGALSRAMHLPGNLAEFDPHAEGVMYWASEFLDQDTVSGICCLLDFAYHQGRSDAQQDQPLRGDGG